MKRWSGVVCALGAAVMVAIAPASGALADPNAGIVVAPNASGMLDCNGHSPLYESVKVGAGPTCTDPLAFYDGQATRFVDNGHYVGHDEPSVKFISSAAGSGNDMTYFMRLGVDPRATPTATSTAVTHYAELSPAPWFGLPICDPKSYPQNPCTPDSDNNSGGISDPNAAGSAFMELQFYPPGFQPLVDGISCSATQYCAAINIDSLECTFGFAVCNNNCIEPVNFAFLQMDGVPAAPPSPQLSNPHTFIPNARTLLMNQGDVLAVTIRDTSQGLLTQVFDLSTGRSGFMVASAANGFMNTNIADCSGTPFNFHAEYSTARQQNEVPWTALEAGVLMQQELGHFEPCSSVASQLAINNTYAGGHSFQDANVFQVCQGGLESGGSGEGPCTPATGVCTNATTETGAPCPTDNSASGALCEFSDANCMPAGNRTIVVDGVAETVRWPIAGCQQNRFENGDLDFDGTSYRADWPDGSAGHPQTFAYLGPFDAHFSPYPTIQFETDLPGSEILCNTITGAGCTAPPLGPGGTPTFYPFWTLGTDEVPGLGSRLCLWNFGNVIASKTVQSFGQDAQYGTPDVARFAGTLASQPMANPQFSGQCASRLLPGSLPLVPAPTVP